MVTAADTGLYLRGIATLLHSWEAIARGASGAEVRRLPGVDAAVFPAGPERAVYNNAVLARDLEPRGRREAVTAMEDAYGAAGVDGYAAWVHESDDGMQGELTRRGYAVAETTRAMGMTLDAAAPVPWPIDLSPAALGDHLAHLEAVGLPPGLLRGTDFAAFHVLMARLDGVDVATGLAHDHAGDCGVLNVSTLACARRRGIGTALTARLVADAADRGCVTASLQASEMAERVYAAVGFRDLGRIHEYRR